MSALLAVLVSATAQTFAGTARSAINSVLPQTKLLGTPLSEAIGFIRDVSGANINVDWKALEAINISKETQVNVNLRNARVGKILSQVLAEASGSDLLTYYIDGDIIEITTRAEADKKLVVVVYYVDDLLSLDDTFNYSALNSFSPASSGGGSGGSGGGSSGSSAIFSGGSANQSNTNDAATKDQKAKNLIKLIETMIRPEVWKDNGGAAQIEYFNGNLIIAAPRSVHELIGGPLN